ncbi:ADP-ribosyl cyclase/cyclic ADP-ribose hydrolase-like isoform X2 [Patiria miniata]|nr:ADP-ribosyl cyclase/cyclic ADP-ribose hydrolase-like isoform X2 [Patiria miniata]
MGQFLLLGSVCLFLPFLASGHMIHYRSADPSASLLNSQARGPTTSNISDIFVGRCEEHVQCLQQDQCNTNTTLRGTCDQLWGTFVDAFAYKDPCQAGNDDYDAVIAAAMPHANKDESLFWSGLPKLALNNGRVTGRYTILEETLPGYIANGLTWCGQTGAPGINYNTPCPSAYSSGCANETMYTFWRAASRAFARQATGTISVALDGSRTNPPAFRNTSTFATNELPNLNTAAVTHVNILLVYDISVKGDNRRALCDKGSIKDLQTLLTDRGFTYTCIEGPRGFKFLQCAGDPDNARCVEACSFAVIPNASIALVLAASLLIKLVTGVRN